MSAKKPGRKYEVELDYTYISKASLRRWVIGFVSAVIVVVAAVVWITHEPSVESRAASAIHDAESALAEARVTPQAKSHAEEIAVAAQKLAEAQAARDAKKHQQALNVALEVQRIAQQIKQAVAESDAQIFDVAGKVELQHAARDRWETARVGTRLYEGDFVKTGANGTADIVSSDGTLFRVKPDSLFEVQRTKQISNAAPGEASHQSEIKLTYGNIDTSTGEKSHTLVKTDSGTTDVSSRSRVGVDVDAQQNTDVRSYGGSATYSTTGGQKVALGEREGLRAGRGGVGEKFRIPEAPGPLSPDNNVVYDFKKHEPITLRWSKVPVASRYKLQIAQSRLFVPDSLVVDLADRQGTEAVATVQEEGSYFWRVGTVTKEGTSSEWSEVRRFKVLSEAEQNADRPPPVLQVERPKVFQNVVILAGKTEPGASVTVNGEAADTDSSGAFKKTITLNTEGFNTIVIKAVNGAGKETTRREIVNIQSY